MSTNIQTQEPTQTYQEYAVRVANGSVVEYGTDRRRALAWYTAAKELGGDATLLTRTITVTSWEENA